MFEPNPQSTSSSILAHPSIQKLLDTIPVAGLATANPDGSPWATALHFAHDGQYLYWFSSEKVVHSVNIARDPRVSLTLWSSDESEGLAGVYIQSTAEITTERKQAEEAYTAKFGSVPDGFAPYSVYRAALGHIDSAKTTGQLWYLISQ